MKKIDYITKEMIINELCPDFFNLQNCKTEECCWRDGELSCEECWNREIGEEE